MPKKVYTLKTLNGDINYLEDNRTTCKGLNCERVIAWAVSGKGKKHPFDPETGESHFKTCPDANRFRRARGK